MRPANSSLQSAFFGRAILAVLLFVSSGCAVTPPKVDPYSTLLPAGRTILDGTASFSAAGLKQSTAYLVVGANFVTYTDVWNKFQKSAEAGENLYWSQAFLIEVQAQWSPAKTTSLVVEELRKRFKDVVVVDDLAEAQSKRAQWVVMFDHAFVQISTATATWTNSTSIDLLDEKFRRVVATSTSEYKDYGQSWSDGDAARFMKYRGDDVVRSVRTAIAQFDAQVAARP